MTKLIKVDGMKKNMIKSVCWDITSRCNECCGFCYRNPNNEELDLNSNKIILKKLIDFGVDKISFVGGEPLLYNGLFELLEWGRKYAKDKTIFSITTNAILLTEDIGDKIRIDEEAVNKILKTFNWITFSLDAPNRNIQKIMGRNSLHFDRIIAILEYLNDIKCHNKVKINTVVSKINANYILDLYQVLCKYNVNRWKIFRFLPSRGNALEFKDKYYISETDFIRKIKEVNSVNVTNKMSISINGYDLFDNSYITISSDGKLIVYDGENYKNCVDLLNEDINDILKYIDIEGHIRNRSDFLRS